MVNMLVLCPNIVVVMSGPEFSSCPLRLHVIEMGLSPLETTHINWAKAPVLYLSVLPIMFSKITLKKFRRLF